MGELVISLLLLFNLNSMESIASNSTHCKKTLRSSSNSDTEVLESCNIQPVKRRRKVLKKMAGRSRFSETQINNAEYTTDELNMLKVLIEKYHVEVLKSVCKLYNEQAVKAKMQARGISEVYVMAKYINWCNCPTDDKDKCKCPSIKIPNRPSNCNASAMATTSRNSQKRSYDEAISSAIGNQIADIINSLVSNEHISVQLGYEACQFYNNMVRNGREFIVRMFIRKHGIAEKISHMERDMEQFRDCM